MKVAPALAAMLAAALATAVGAAKDERTFAVLRFTNNQLTKGRMDPIVSPGKPSEHVHVVMGGSNFGLSSKGDDLVKSNCTNSQIKGDNSNYWFPALYFHDTQNDTFESVDIFYVNVYYFFEPTNDDIKPFPVGMSMVIGDAMERRVPAAGVTGNLDPSQGPINPIKWVCPRAGNNYDPPNWPADSNGTMAGVGDPNNKGEGIGLPFMNCDGFASPLRADIQFPSCYNPDAGLYNYTHNMDFPTVRDGKQDCPEGYIHVPHLFFEVYWNTPAFADRWQQNAGSQPFVLAEGDVTGYSSHGDFMSGWDQDVLQQIIDNCNAGDAGMNQCPGLLKGTNDVDCTIPSPVHEQVDGVMDALPGHQVLQGWWYGTAETPSHGASASSAQSTVSAPSSSASSLAGYQYVGCYKDNAARVLVGEEGPSLGAVDSANCVDYCKGAGFALAGTEYGGQCYCGNELFGSSRLDESKCNMPCEGDLQQTCGGVWALSLFSSDGEAKLSPTMYRRDDPGPSLGVPLLAFS